jgi:hypothetical protein
MQLTKKDVEELLQFAAVSAAQKAGVAQDDLDSIDTLIEAVSVKDQRLGSALAAFRKEYMAWFDFCEGVCKSGRSGGLSPVEAARHQDLMLSRDRARESFIRALKASGAC